MGLSDIAKKLAGDTRDKIALVKVGDAIVLMVEVYPTAFMLALDENQALNLARNLQEIVGSSGKKEDESPEDFLARILKAKKVEGEQ